MSHTVKLVPLFRMISLRDLFDVLAMLRDFREPLASPEGLRRAVDLLLKLGESLGLDRALLAKVREFADDPHVFEIVLAVLRFTLSFVGQDPQSTIAQSTLTDDATAQSLSIADWFALVMQLLELLRKLKQ
jgi:hypothetical protein